MWTCSEVWNCWYSSHPAFSFYLFIFLSASLKTFTTFYIEYYSILWIETTFYFHLSMSFITFICSSVDMFFHSLAVVSDDLWTPMCQLFVWTCVCVSLRYIPRVGLLGHMVTSSFLCTHLHFGTWSAPPHVLTCPACPAMLRASFALSALPN